MKIIISNDLRITAIQAAVDRIIGRSNTKKTQEGHEGEDKDETGK